jgi:peptidoglycan/xylan/chitin deacetylase (PgdA/CDA1 family)
MKIPLHALLPTIKGIPILMYHRVWEGQSDNLTITPQNLRAQFSYLKDNGYSSISLSDFLDILSGKVELKPNSFLLSFDDGYRNNLTFAYPILQEYGFKAVFFIIGNTLDGTAPKETEAINDKMTVSELEMLDPEIVQLALHSYNHIHFKQNSLQQIQMDIEQNIFAFEQSELPFNRVLAYPFGGRPAKVSEFKRLKKWMESVGIEAAFRIGNQPCKIPVEDAYEIKRIDILGTDSISDFAIKLRKGKLKPF